MKHVIKLQKIFYSDIDDSATVCLQREIILPIQPYEHLHLVGNKLNEFIIDIVWHINDWCFYCKVNTMRFKDSTESMSDIITQYKNNSWVEIPKDSLIV